MFYGQAGLPLKTNDLQAFVFFTAQRYASAVLVIALCLSVCLFVCHKSELCRNGLTNQAGFFGIRAFFDLSHTVF